MEEYLKSTLHPEKYPVGVQTPIGYITRHEPSRFYLDGVRLYGIKPSNKRLHLTALRGFLRKLLAKVSGR